MLPLITPTATFYNFFQYSTSIMTNSVERQMALQDTTVLYDDLKNVRAGWY